MATSLSIAGQTLLRVPPNRLVGRESDLASLEAILDDPHTRLMTLTGPGGVGKTHLATILAASVSPRFDDDVIFIPLASVRDPSMVLPTIARAVGLRESPDQDMIDALGSVLTSRRALIVLDNLEQVLDAGADIGALIAMTERPVFLTTSRAPLRLRAERYYPVTPLPLPQITTSATRASLKDNPTIALFVERAQAADPTFTLTDANATVIAEICHRLDGLPLAIELAAAMTRVLSPRALHSRMDRRLHMHISGASDLPDRQRTLRNTVGWSVDLLQPHERTLFRRLAVFDGGISLDGLQAVGDIPADDLMAIVADLVDKSLLRRDDDDEVLREPRFRMLTTIREFAREQLEATDEAETIRERHLRWLLDLAQDAAPGMTGPEQAHWLRRLDAEHDNIRAALEWALWARPVEGLRLASTIWRYWASRSLLTEGHTWLSQFLDVATEAEPRIRALAFNSIGNLSIDLGDYPGAYDAYLRALPIWEEAGETYGIANTLNGLGLVEWYQGDYQRARTHHEQSLELRRHIDDRFGQANSLTNLGNVIKDLGDVRLSRTMHEQALAIRQALGDHAGIGYSYINLGDCARRLDDHAGASDIWARALKAFRDVGDTLGVGYALYGLGLAHYLGGEPQKAAGYFREALDLRSTMGDRRGIIECLEFIAALAFGSSGKHMAAAITLFSASDTLRERLGATRPDADQALFDPILASLRRTAPDTTYVKSESRGQHLSLPETVLLALETAQAIAEAEATQPPPVAEPIDGLSHREVEVVQLVAQGMTNAQIAERLFLSRRTIDAHLRRIFGKLEIASRSELVRYAADREMI